MKNRMWIAAVAMTAGMGAAIVAAPLASATPVASSLIAQDSTPAPLAPATVMVGVDADIPSGLTVRGSAGKPVAVQAAGERTCCPIACGED